MKPLKFKPHIRAAPGLMQWIGDIKYGIARQESRQRARKGIDASRFDHACDVLLCNIAVAKYLGRRLQVRLDRNASRLDRAFGTAHIAAITSLCASGLCSVETITTSKQGGYETQSVLTPHNVPKIYPDISFTSRPAVVLRTEDAGFITDTALPDGNHRSVQMYKINDYLESLEVKASEGLWVMPNEGSYDDWVSTSAMRLQRILRDNGSGGRLWSGWWQDMSKEDRERQIRICGEEISHIDYSTMYLRLAYAQAGQKWPFKADAYQAHPKGDRDGWKVLTNAMLAADKPLSHMPRRCRPLLPFKSGQAIALVGNRHKAIRHLFGVGAGDYQRMESDILCTVLLLMQDEGLSGLPVHDCIICPKSEATQVANLMSTVASTLYGVHIPAA